MGCHLLFPVEKSCSTHLGVPAVQPARAEKQSGTDPLLMEQLGTLAIELSYIKHYFPNYFWPKSFLCSLVPVLLSPALSHLFPHEPGAAQVFFILGGFLKAILISIKNDIRLKGQFENSFREVIKTVCYYTRSLFAASVGTNEYKSGHLKFSVYNPQPGLNFSFHLFLVPLWVRWSDVSTHLLYQHQSGGQSNDYTDCTELPNYIWITQGMSVCVCVCVCDVKGTQMSNLAIKRECGERTSCSGISSLSPTQKHPCFAVTAAEHQLVAF